MSRVTPFQHTGYAIYNNTRQTIRQLYTRKWNKRKFSDQT